MEQVNWISVEGRLPQHAGWYLAAVNPENHNEISLECSNAWRQRFGCTKVWFNPDAVGKWYEPDPHGMRSKEIGKRVTHWVELPKVPLL
jgi:hypothetical protein